MKSSKKALAFALAAAMAITGVPVTNAGAATTTAKLGATKATIYAGSSKYISVSTPSSWKSVKLSVSSSKTSVASVKKNNAKKKIRVDAVKAGTAKVTVKVTAKKSGKTVKKTLSANITVKDYKVRLVDAAGTTVSNTTIDTTVGTAVKLTAKTAPANDKVTFTSDNESVATVDASGNVTPVKAGTVTITAASAKATDKVTINVSEAAKEGVTATLQNPYDSTNEKLKDVVLVSDKAIINVRAVKDGKPLAGQTIVFTYKETSNTGNFSEYKLESTTQVTGQDGIATFVLGYDPSKNGNSMPKSTDTNCEAAFECTATLAATGEKVTTAVNFAAIKFGGVNVDVKKTKLAQSTNYAKNASETKGITKTHATDTVTGANKDNDPSRVQYVDSQQVSAEVNGVSTGNHAVTFGSYLPVIELPNSKSVTATNAVKDIYDDAPDFPYTTGEYAPYDQLLTEGKDNPHKITLQKEHAEITWAHLNFDYLQLSEDTRLIIKTYYSEAHYASKNADSTYVIKGAHDEQAFSYPIPLQAGTSKVIITTQIESFGRVNDDLNAGYSLKNIEYVYIDTVGTSNGGEVPLTNAKVTWSLVPAEMSPEKELSNKVKSELYALNPDLGLDVNKKVTYKTPVFPYTGNAVLTQYDKNGQAEAYFVCPTENESEYNNGQYSTERHWVYKNRNVLSYDDGHFYKVSLNETKDNSTATISQSENGDTVTVDATKTGISTLKGVITDSEGNALPGFDATNDTLYTTVQWSPLPIPDSSTTLNPESVDDFFTFMGQKVDAVAQLVDANNNPVSTSNVGIKFYDSAEKEAKVGADFGLNNKVTTIKNTGLNQTEGITDSNGQVKLTVQAADTADLLKLHANPANSNQAKNYKVVLKIGDKYVDKANIHWLNADLSYTYVNHEKDTKEADGKTIKSHDKCYVENATNEALSAFVTKTENTEKDTYAYTTVQDAVVGTNWLYAVRPYSFYGGKNVDISGLNVKMSGNGVGSVTAKANVLGTVSAYSEKKGDMNIESQLDKTSVGTNATFTIGGKTYNNVGYDETNLDKKLTIKVKWTTSGLKPVIETTSGKRVTITGSSTSTDVYVTVKDKFDNVVNTSDIIMTANNGATLKYYDAQGDLVTPVDGKTIPKEAINSKGTVKVQVTANTNPAENSSTTITASVDNKSTSIIINWVKPVINATDLVEETDPTVAKQVLKGTDTIVLTFKQNISTDAPLYKGSFLVQVGDKLYDVASAVASGKTITLKISNGPKEIAKTDTVAVLIKLNAVNPDDSKTYNVYSENNKTVLDDNSSDKFKEDNVPIPGHVITINDRQQ